jgi:PAS domain S-box-containing protein
MELLTGYSRQMVVGQNDAFLRCVPADDRNGNPSSASARSDAAPPTAPVECALHQRDGGSVPVLKNTRRLHDGAGQITGTVCIFTDLRPLKALQAQVARLRYDVPNDAGEDRLIGKSLVMREVRERIRLAAESNATVLILGETGTGKELVAEAIHFQSERQNQPLLKVNCSALPETLLESELFGHVKGAFTGAVKDKPGRFELADGGTLFLDEIGDLSPLIQLKLLRVLQHHEFERVGESRARRADVRITAATHRDLRHLAAAGRFREDLFYRLNVFPIHVPPLRERTTDVPLLVNHFLERFNRETGKSIVQLSSDVRHILMDFCWPGNVRQLENAIEHAFVTCPGPEIGLFDLPVEIRMTELRQQICDDRRDSASGAGSPGANRLLAKTPTKEELLAWLEECHYNKAAVARRAGVDRTTVWRWLKRLEVPPQRAPNR